MAKEQEKKGKTEKELEEAEIDAYMDLEIQDAEAPQPEERLSYLQTRYAQVKNDYKVLQLQKAEAEAKKDENMLNKLRGLFRENFKGRKYTVTELRKLGQKVEDPYVPEKKSD